MKRKTKIGRKDWRGNEADFIYKRDIKTKGTRVRDYEIDDLETDDALFAAIINNEDVRIKFKPKRKYAQ